jgi:uncharacterized Zn finger protein (UPF0148 family)
MKCEICGGTAKKGKLITEQCPYCNADVVIHEHHLKNGKLVCPFTENSQSSQAKHRIEEAEVVVQKGPFPSVLGDRAETMHDFRDKLSKLGVCHGCLGKSRCWSGILP